MIVKLWQKMLLLVCGILFAAGVHAEIPKETYDALKLDKSATSKQLYEALVKRYKDPAEGAGRGTFAQYWEPIAFSKYLDPASSYKPPRRSRTSLPASSASNAMRMKHRCG